jgi:hypothetical protein
MSKKFCHCGTEIPEGRLKALPNTTTCTSCSETGRKGAVTVQIGDGDHTYNDIVILEPEQVNHYNQLFNKPTEDDIFSEDPELTIETVVTPEDPNIESFEQNEEDIYERGEDLIEEIEDQDWELSEED